MKWVQIDLLDVLAELDKRVDAPAVHKDGPERVLADGVDEAREGA